MCHQLDQQPEIVSLFAEPHNILVLGPIREARISFPDATTTVLFVVNIK